MQSCPPHFETSNQLIETPISIQKVKLNLFKIWQDNDVRYPLQSTLFLVCINKLGKAASVAMAENICRIYTTGW